MPLPVTQYQACPQAYAAGVQRPAGSL